MARKSTSTHMPSGASESPEREHAGRVVTENVRRGREMVDCLIGERRGDTRAAHPTVARPPSARRVITDLLVCCMRRRRVRLGLRCVLWLLECVWSVEFTFYRRVHEGPATCVRSRM